MTKMISGWSDSFKKRFSAAETGRDFKACEEFEDLGDECWEKFKKCRYVSKEDEEKADEDWEKAYDNCGYFYGGHVDDDIPRNNCRDRCNLQREEHSKASQFKGCDLP